MMKKKSNVYIFFVFSSSVIKIPVVAGLLPHLIKSGYVMTLVLCGVSLNRQCEVFDRG